MTGIQERDAEEAEPALVSAVVRVKGPDGAIGGAGFLIAPDLVLTCAHVVSDALDRLRDATVEAGTEVTVDVPLAGNADGVDGGDHGAEVQRWIPIRPDQTGDIAVLRLRNRIPGARPLPMIDPQRGVWDHDARAVGFTDDHPDGIWQSGRFRGPTRQGWIQLSRANGEAVYVKGGFSGSPVWDNELGAAVGMMVAAQPVREAQQAFILRVRTLLKEAPELEPFVRPAPPSGHGTKRRGLVLALIAAGVLVVSLAAHVGTQPHGDHSGPKDTAGTSPGPVPAASADGSAASRPSGTTSAGTPTAPPVAGGGPAHGGNSSSGGADGGSSGNDTSGGSSGGSSGSASGGNTTGSKTSGGSGDAGGSGGSNSSSGSGGVSGATPPKPPAPSGHFQLRNVGYGKCLAVNFGGVVFATCADSPATNWTAKAGSSGSYTLYNESVGKCLAVNYNQLYMADCGSTDQSWRTGTSSTVVNLSGSRCLDESSSWPVLASCEPSKSTQHWAKV
ncbi:trypsin-like peptidase domain-containing protein [Streptomyces sp. NPDC015032]|uniref:trypsin-like peptidase domain-containing protein n=1 Tax=Streptomyces sp. NPDC015032 TaxID=3364937 RepID=UPI0036FEADD9